MGTIEALKLNGNGRLIPTDARIAIVGAGPAGLSAAHYLKKNGYRHVVVLEKLGRVGGLCRTITEDGLSFDLGANYITPAYKRVLALAHEFNADYYHEIVGGVLRYRSETDSYDCMRVWDVVRNGGAWNYLKACRRYWRERAKLQGIVDAPGFARIEAHPELCVSFHEWLKRHDLEQLIPLFEIPITVMGYGYVKCPVCPHAESASLKEIPAPYALKYMTLPTFRAMVFKFSPIMRLFPWPKRFVYGYQRLWESVATRLDVRLNVDIQRIRRHDRGVEITFTQAEQAMNSMRRSCPVTLNFDHLILTCPLSLDVLGRETAAGEPMLDVSVEEAELFGRILTYSYALAACSIAPNSWPEDWPRILCTVPATQEGWPWAVTRQMPESEMTQFYMHLPENPSDYKDKQARECACDADATEPGGPFVQGMRRHNQSIPPGVARFMKQTGMKVMEDEWYTYDHWPYFQHVTVDEMRENRFYTNLEALQGTRRTFYGGSLMNFELVENVMEYSEHLVKRYFVGTGG